MAGAAEVGLRLLETDCQLPPLSRDTNTPESMAPATLVLGSRGSNLNREGCQCVPKLRNPVVLPWLVRLTQTAPAPGVMPCIRFSRFVSSVQFEPKSWVMKIWKLLGGILLIPEMIMWFPSVGSTS